MFPNRDPTSQTLARALSQDWLHWSVSRRGPPWVDWAARLLTATGGLCWRFSQSVFSERSRLEKEETVRLEAGRWKEEGEGTVRLGGGRWKEDAAPALGQGLAVRNQYGKMLLYATRAAPMRPLCRVGVVPMEYPKMLACGYSARARCGARVGCWANWLISACRSSTCAPVRARVCVALQARYRARRGDATILGRF